MFQAIWLSFCLEFENYGVSMRKLFFALQPSSVSHHISIFMHTISINDVSWTFSTTILNMTNYFNSDRLTNDVDTLFVVIWSYIYLSVRMKLEHVFQTWHWKKPCVFLINIKKIRFNFNTYKDFIFRIFVEQNKINFLKCTL